MRKAYFALKRSLDVVSSLIGIIISTVIPLLIVLPIIIRLTSKGPALFKQVRAGKEAKPFLIYKFRTMIVEQYDSNGVEIMSEDRITKVGKFLRKTSLDEIPQLFNVLNGTMSIVGPRPMLDYQVPRCNDDEARRFEVRPGVTGLAQVMGRNNIPWEERLRYDIEYVDNISFSLDLKIILKTFLAVFRKKGTDVMPEYRGKDRFSRDYKADSAD